MCDSMNLFGTNMDSEDDVNKMIHFEDEYNQKREISFEIDKRHTNAVSRECNKNWNIFEPT